MPPTGIRCTMQIEDGRFGISETQVRPGSSLTDAIPFFISLYKKRMQLCGPPAVPFRGRLSLIGSRRVTRILSSQEIALVGPATATTMSGPGGTVGPNNSDQPKACILCKMYAGQAISKNLYLAGVPDEVIRENPEGPALALLPAYGSLLTAYFNELTAAGWGFIGQADSAAPLPITPIVFTNTRVVDGLLGISIAGAGGGITLTTKLKVFGQVMFNNAYASANGIREIQEIVPNFPLAGQTTFYLRGTEEVPNAQIKFRGSVMSLDYTFRAYTSGTVVGQTTRQRGNRFLAGPGRRTIRKKVSL